MFKTLICFLLFRLAVSTLDYDEYYRLMQDLIPYELFEVPAHQLTVIYNGKELNPGDELVPNEMLNQPQISWPSKPDCYYHLLMYDGDAPSRTNHSLNDIKHWLLVNIPGGNVDRGDPIAEYGGGLPQQHTGIHRYVFLLFESPEMMVFNEPRSIKNSLRNRLNFNKVDFCRKYNLHDVYAANYLISVWEPYVDDLSKGLSS